LLKKKKIFNPSLVRESKLQKRKKERNSHVNFSPNFPEFFSAIKQAVTVNKKS
jgi:hypothetical protein